MDGYFTVEPYLNERALKYTGDTPMMQMFDDSEKGTLIIFNEIIPKDSLKELVSAKRGTIRRVMYGR